LRKPLQADSDGVQGLRPRVLLVEVVVVVLRLLLLPLLACDASGNESRVAVQAVRGQQKPRGNGHG
jgi:hypothetical protein